MCFLKNSISYYNNYSKSVKHFSAHWRKISEEIKKPPQRLVFVHARQAFFSSIYLLRMPYARRAGPLTPAAGQFPRHRIRASRGISGKGNPPSNFEKRTKARPEGSCLRGASASKGTSRQTCKPGSVERGHLSRRIVTDALKRCSRPYSGGQPI